MFRDVLKKIDRAYFLIVASGPLEPEFKALAKRLGISSRAIFTGQVKYSRGVELLQSGGCLCFRIKDRDSGLVVAEAKACSLSRGRTYGPGVSECINDQKDGFLVDDGLLSLRRSFFCFQTATSDKI